MNKKRGGVISVCAVVVVLVVAFFGTNAVVNNPQRLLNLGERCLLEMDYEQAVVYFERVIKIEPKNVRAYTGAADAYVGLAEIGKAIEELRLGLERTNAPAIMDFLARLERDAEGYTETSSNSESNQPTEPNDGLVNSVELTDEIKGLLDDILSANVAGDGLEVLRLLSSNAFFDYFTDKDLAAESASSQEHYVEDLLDYKSMSIKIYYLATNSEISVVFDSYGGNGIVDYAQVWQKFPNSPYGTAWHIDGGEWRQQYRLGGEYLTDYERWAQYSISEDGTIYTNDMTPAQRFPVNP